MFPTPDVAKQRIENGKTARIHAALAIIRDEVQRVMDTDGAGRVNIQELLSARPRSLDYQLANQLGQNALACKHDDYMDVRSEAAKRVCAGLEKAGWRAHFQSWEMILRWEWPPEPAEAP